MDGALKNKQLRDEIKQSLPFTEKYKPRKIDDLILDDFIELKIRKIINDKELTNTIFTGIPGVGKTSSIRCIINNIYSIKNVKDMVFKIGFGTNERGIKSLSEVEGFCKKSVNLIDGYCKHKLLILEDADNSVTSKALKLFSPILSKYPKIVMIFSCNDQTKINESIQSKCSTIVFNKVASEKYLKKFKFICDKENINYNEDGLKYLYRIYDGDIRKILNTIELMSIHGLEIIRDQIDKGLSIISENDIKELINSVLEKNVQKIFKICDDFQKKGYNSLDVLLTIVKFHESYNLDEDNKMKILAILCEETYEMSKNDSKELHLISTLLRCCGF